MKIVKDGLFDREYYIYISTMKQIEFYKYTWCSDVEKYAPNYNSIAERNVNIEKWESFKMDMKKKGFIHIDEAIKIGAKRS